RGYPAMTPRGERRVAACLWTVALVLAVGAISLAGIALFRPRGVRPLPPAAASRPLGGPRLTPQEIEAVSRRQMSRSIVKAAPPPPPKPVVPPLEMVVRLSGIIDYGAGAPREAFIEIRQS